MKNIQAYFYILGSIPLNLAISRGAIGLCPDET